ncbi:proton channel OtopLc [Patella vulgata]|uniref:proton channel OtopLc n=1 Tax=Patella vulgata TaxID=6465 RepID=UPI0024A98E09|nr:proton channel OtopLc [Patella vulgata]
MDISKSSDRDSDDTPVEYTSYAQASVNPNLEPANYDLVENSPRSPYNPGQSKPEGCVTMAAGSVVTMDTESSDTTSESDVFLDKNENMYDTSSNSESDDTQIWVPSGGRRHAGSIDSRSNLSTLSNHGSADPSTPRGDNANSPVSPPRGRFTASLLRNGGMSTSLTEESRSATPAMTSSRDYTQYSDSSPYLPSAVSPLRRVQVSREDRAERVVTMDSEVTSLPNGDSGIGNEDNSPNNDDVFLSDSPPPSLSNKRRSDVSRISYNLIYNQPVVDSLFVNLSALYAMLVVVLGTVLPLAENFTPLQRPYLFQGFYIYLYGVGVLFLIFLYIFVLKTTGCCSCCKKSSNQKDKILTPLQKPTNHHKFTYDDSPNAHTGSFYLRLGAVAFGIGSMIKSGLQFGIFFETGPLSGCLHVTYGLRHLLHLFFTFSQLYFVFLNSKICVQRFKLITRFGLMHMVAVNICVWAENIVHETLIKFKESSAQSNHTFAHHLDDMLDCNDESIMNSVVESSGPYLYPCSIEYSLICASIVYVMWSNIGRIGISRNHDGKQWSAKAKANRLNVDCSSSSRGLFLGIILVVAVVITIIAFFVMIKIKSRSGDAIMVEHLSEIICYVMTAVAVILAFYKVQPLGYRKHQSMDLEQILLIIGLFGIYLFSLLSIIAASFSQSMIQSLLIMISGVLRMFQATLQTVFIMNTIRRFAGSKEHEQEKPGRELVTFLLVANIALWGMNTFEVQQTEANPIQMDFYGLLAWSIFTHISSPLSIFYRFHSTVCLSNIWKHAWKRRVARL